MDKLRAQIKASEGLRLKPYLDTAGRLTIGWGRCLEKGVSEEEAEMLLEADLREASDVYLRLPWSKVRHLNVNRRRVIVEMIYNMGLGGVLTFRRMWAALKVGDFHKAADEMMDSKWAQQVKGRAVRLADEMRMG